MSKFRSIAKELRFPLLFSITFVILYGFNIAFIGLITKGGLYSGYLDNHLNYINLWRTFTIKSSSKILTVLGFHFVESKTQIRVSGHGGYKLIYSCLGYGIMSLFAAFVANYKATLKDKLPFLILGLIQIQGLNTLRLVGLSIFRFKVQHEWLDHHFAFNFFLYTILMLNIFWWTNKKTKPLNLTQEINQVTIKCIVHS